MFEQYQVFCCQSKCAIALVVSSSKFVVYFNLVTKRHSILSSFLCLTQVQHSSTHPVWNEELRLLVHVPELQSLHVEIRDWDLLNASDHIGRRASLSPAGHMCVFAIRP